MAKKKFVGFSTVDRDKPPFTLTGADLIKRDLMNGFMTRKGSRVMRPEYGCGVWDYIHDPLDEITKSAIEDEVLEIINGEPRASLLEIRIEEYEHGINVFLLLELIDSYTPEELVVRFDRNSEEI